MKPEFVGIERRLDRLNECLQKLEPLRSKTLDEFLADTYLNPAHSPVLYSGETSRIVGAGAGTTKGR